MSQVLDSLTALAARGSEPDSSVHMSTLNLFAKYDDYILRNASSITSIESTLRTLTYLLPGRFQDSEAASETLYAFLNLLGIHHDSILARAIEKLPRNNAKNLPITAHNRYTKYWSSKSKIYRLLSTAITTLQHLSFLLEIIARKNFGEKGRWRIIISIEAIKAFCRIVLLDTTRSKPLVFPHVSDRQVDPAEIEESLDHAALSSSYVEATDKQPSLANGTLAVGSDTVSNEKSIAEKFSSQDDVTNYLMKKVLYVEDLRPAANLVHSVSGLGKFAEVMYTVRPVIYAFLLSRSKDKRNWTPWLVGITIEYVARELAKRDFDKKVPGGLRALTKLEKEEMNRRAWSMGWWAIRGAFYQNVTKPKLDVFINGLEKVPLLGLAGTLARDYEYWYESYFTTASI